MSEEKECRHYNEIDNDREYCQLTYNILKKKCKTKCKDIKNCYYKQLQTAKEENEKLKRIYIDAFQNYEPVSATINGYRIEAFNTQANAIMSQKINTLTQQNKQMREALKKNIKAMNFMFQPTNPNKIDMDDKLKILSNALILAQQALGENRCD